MKSNLIGRVRLEAPRESQFAIAKTSVDDVRYLF
jgi:hypothetical protein